jgi:hypothetical protein
METYFFLIALKVGTKFKYFIDLCLYSVIESVLFRYNNPLYVGLIVPMLYFIIIITR